MKAASPVCIVVADQAQARVYLLRGAVMGQARGLVNPSARQHDRELRSDRPGRVYERAPAARGRRGAAPRHATGGERTPRRQAAQAFARDIARAVQETRRGDGFERLVLVAPPRFLGRLRRVLPAALRASVVAEHGKDWAHLPAARLRPRLMAAARRARRPF